ncbi:MAG: AbrB/MazE/SpoVT family DNA-binding domain-containing protein [Leptolyngbyaceae cyanobacterium MAG.088]|nr:AbrB/MazE/SpoVT family DNA-binding domain-containing protein [Leptolyngbyaceae cyanobacterium MAG.088]
MRTRVFQSGNSQAVRIPRELQFERLDIDYEIERQGDMLMIRPVGPPLLDAMERFAAFSADFMAAGRPDQGTQQRETL